MKSDVEWAINRKGCTRYKRTDQFGMVCDVWKVWMREGRQQQILEFRFIQFYFCRHDIWYIK